MAPLLRVEWVDESLHEPGLDLLLDRGRESPSLIDAVSFELMRDRGLEEAFAYDGDFEHEGFSPIR